MGLNIWLQNQSIYRWNKNAFSVILFKAKLLICFNIIKIKK